MLWVNLGELANLAQSMMRHFSNVIYCNMGRRIIGGQSVLGSYVIIKQKPISPPFHRRSSSLTRNNKRSPLTN